MEEMGVKYELLAGLGETEKKGKCKMIVYMVRGGGAGELKQSVKIWDPEQGRQK